MTLRTKLLILLLRLSVAPSIVLRVNGARSLARLRDELATASRNALVNQTMNDLKRLVEDHGLFFEQGRRFLETALNLQALGLVAPDSLQRLSVNPGQADPGLYCAHYGPDDCDPIDVRLDAAGVVKTGGMGSGAGMGRGMGAMGDMVGDMGGMARPTSVELQTSRLFAYQLSRARMDGDALWQASLLKNGDVEIYPAPINAARTHVLAMKMRNFLDKARPGFIWSTPMVDPLTRLPVLAMATNIPGADDDAPVATAAVFTIQSLFGVQKQLESLSPEVAVYLVQVGDESLDILAEAKSDRTPRFRSWMMAEQRRTLSSRNATAFKHLARTLGRGESSISFLDWRGRPSLWAGAPVGDQGAALLVIAPEAAVTAKADAFGSFVESVMNQQLRTTGIFVALMLVAVVVVALYATRSLTARLKRLASAAESLGRGNFEITADIPGDDEVARLGRTFDHMVPALKAHVRLRESLEVAMEVQQNLLPKAPPSIPGLDAAGVSVYCDETGGDFFDYIVRDDPESGRRRLLCVVGDVSGHGLSAALLMASCRSAVRARATEGASLADIAGRVNRLLAEDTEETGQFVTAFLLELDPDAGRLDFVRAGHEPMLVLDRDSGDVEMFLGGAGAAWGVLPEGAYTDSRLDRLAGRTFVLVTDGITEARNEQGEAYGRDRLTAALQGCAGMSARETMDALLHDLYRFTGKAKIEDDVTLVVVRA